MPRRAPESLSIALADGGTLDLSRPPVDANPVRVDVLRAIASRDFDACPICGAPATDDEHVPPASMGGHVMTRTCGPCNHGLGSRIERDLADWWDGALALPAFSGDAVKGRRRAARVLHRTASDGSFVIAVDGSADPAIRDLLISGELDFSAALPDRNRYMLALLKHAYLAACMYFGAPPAEAGQARTDLIAARNAPDRETVPISALALGLYVLRADAAGRALPPVCLAVAHIDEKPIQGVILGGRVFVSWISDPSRAGSVRAPGRIGASMKVGPQMEGVIANVDSAPATTDQAD